MKLLLLDVEETLFDWSGAWRASFEALLAGLAHATNLPRHELLPIVHRLRPAAKGWERAVRSDDAERFGICPSAMQILVDEFEDNLSLRTAPFPGVVGTLGKLRERGVRIVARSDAPRSFAADRLVQLGLDGVIDVLFTAADDEVTTFRRARRSPQCSELVVLPGAKSGAPSIEAILKHCDVPVRDCVYVASSALPDVAGAHQLGVQVFCVERAGRFEDLLRLA